MYLLWCSCSPNPIYIHHVQYTKYSQKRTYVHVYRMEWNIPFSFWRRNHKKRNNFCFGSTICIPYNTFCQKNIYTQQIAIAAYVEEDEADGWWKLWKKKKHIWMKWRKMKNSSWYSDMKNMEICMTNIRHLLKIIIWRIFIFILEIFIIFLPHNTITYTSLAIATHPFHKLSCCKASWYPCRSSWISSASLVMLSHRKDSSLCSSTLISQSPFDVPIPFTLPTHPIPARSQTWWAMEKEMMGNCLRWNDSIVFIKNLYTEINHVMSLPINCVDVDERVTNASHTLPFFSTLMAYIERTNIYKVFASTWPSLAVTVVALKDWTIYSITFWIWE